MYFKSKNSSLSSSKTIIDGTELPIENVKSDVYVTSSDLLIWFPELSSGLNIPYQCVTLHAIKRDTNPNCMYLQLQSDTGNDDTFVEAFVALEDANLLNQFYEALSACSSLHPDPEDEEDETMGAIGIDGSSGDNNNNSQQPTFGGPWFTAENLQNGQADDIEIDLVDNGNGYDGEMAGVEVEVELPTAQVGQRRTRDDNDDESDDENGEEKEETKWRKI